MVWFNLFDQNQDGFISEDDVQEFGTKILEFTQWPENSTVSRFMREVNETFYQTILEKKVQWLFQDEEDQQEHNEMNEMDELAEEMENQDIQDKGNENKISKELWLHMWERLTYGSMGMQDFPVWLQLLPKVLFEVVDFKGDHEIDVDELTEFYADFTKIKEPEPAKLAQDAFNDMTDNGKYELNVTTYEQTFANFLLGRTSNYGPGMYVFGTVHTEQEPFKLTMPPEEKPMSAKQAKKERRRFSKNGLQPVFWKHA